MDGIARESLTHLAFSFLSYMLRVCANPLTPKASDCFYRLYLPVDTLD
jgi:hypothetical protein